MTATIIQFAQFAALPKTADLDGEKRQPNPGTLVAFPKEYNPPANYDWIYKPGGALDYWKATGKAYNDLPERPVEAWALASTPRLLLGE